MTVPVSRGRKSIGKAAALVPAASVALIAAGAGAGLVTAFMDADGRVEIERVGDRFGLSKGQLAETVGLRPETLQRARRASAARTQGRVTEMLEILGRVAAWAGGERQAMAWYRAEPLPAFGGRTAEALVKDGKAGALRTYLDHLAMGGFA